MYDLYIPLEAEPKLGDKFIRSADNDFMKHLVNHPDFVDFFGKEGEVLSAEGACVICESGYIWEKKNVTENLVKD